MGFIEFGADTSKPSQRQRWGHYLTLIVALSVFGLGLLVRDNTIRVVTQYVDNQAGITANYPSNWLLDTQGDYIFRVRNTTQPGFGTLIQVTIRPINIASPNERNVLDNLSLNRAQTLTEYTVGEVGSNLERPQYNLLNDSEFTFMEYTFVSALINPFLNTTPVVVRGIDILVIRGGQAIIMTFQTAAIDYNANLPFFLQFLETVEF